MAPAVDAVSNLNTMLVSVIFNNFISSETLMAFFTIHKRVAESAKMTTCNPCLWIHKDRTIYADIMW